MTKIEMQELVNGVTQLLHIHLAEAIQLSQDTGLNLQLARKIWLYSVLSELQLTAEYWNIPLTHDSLNYCSILQQANQRDLFDRDWES